MTLAESLARLLSISTPAHPRSAEQFPGRSIHLVSSGSTSVGKPERGVDGAKNVDSVDAGSTQTGVECSLVLEAECVRLVGTTTSWRAALETSSVNNARGAPVRRDSVWVPL